MSDTASTLNGLPASRASDHKDTTTASTPHPKKRRRRRRKPKRTNAEAPQKLDLDVLARRADEALRELARAAAAHRGLAAHDIDALDHFTLPTTVSLVHDAQRPRRLRQDVEQHIAALHRSSMAFHLGHVYCFLTNEPDGPTTSPNHPEETFGGYAASGRPDWLSFTNLCLYRGEERVDQLYATRPEIIALVQGEEELNGDLIHPLRHGDLSYRVRGQVVAGLIPESLVPGDTKATRVALTLQIIEIRYGKAPLRLRTNLIGLTRQQILEAAAAGRSRDAAERLRRMLRSTDRRLSSIASKLNSAKRRGKSVVAADLVRPLLHSLRGEMERIFRPIKRRTRHAQDRHTGGERPTSDAMGDFSTARREHFLHDTARNTIIVLGPKRRAHVFSHTGQHVTSLRLEPGELDRKIERKRWQPLDREGVDHIRSQLAHAQD